MKTKDGVALIAEERERQIKVYGWSPEHDDEHTNGELAQAAGCYVWPTPRPIFVKMAWPWDRKWWKPEIHSMTGTSKREKRKARIRTLVKAGALIAAEIDRLQRMK